MLQRFPRLDLNSCRLVPDVRVCSGTTTFLGSIRSTVLFEQARALFLPIFSTNPGGVQHARDGFRDAFGAQGGAACTGRRKICASRKIRDRKEF
jgi:hypothetical protein